MSCGTRGPSTSGSPARTRSPPWTRRYLPCGTRCSRSMPLSLRTMIVRLPRRFSSSSSTRPSISAMTAGSLGRPRLEQLGDPRQPAGDVLGAAHLARGLGHQGAGRDHLAVVDLDARPLGDVLVVEGLPLGVHDDDLRVQVPLVLDDRPPDVARGVDLDLHRLVLDDVVEPDRAADLGQDRDVVRVPLDDHLAAGDLLAVLDHDHGAVGHVELVQLATLGVEDLDLAVARQRDVLPLVVGDDVQADELDLALALGLDVLLLDGAGGDAADVEGPHGELGAGLADRLRGDDPDGHAHLDDLPGGQVHAVAPPADAQRRLAGHRAADLDLLDLHVLQLLGRRQGDHLVLLDHDLVGERVDDVHPADPAPDRLDQADLDLLTLVDDALGDPLRGPAVLHGDHDVLRARRRACASGSRCRPSSAPCRPGPCGRRGSS